MQGPGRQKRRPKAQNSVRMQVSEQQPKACTCTRSPAGTASCCSSLACLHPQSAMILGSPCQNTALSHAAQWRFWA